MVDITVIGSGDAFGSGGRANTCFFVESERRKFLIDFGASALIGLKAHKIDPNEIELIFITHLHGDHFGGLVFLLREASLYGARTSPLTIVGPEGLQARLWQALEAFFPGGASATRSFDLHFIELSDRHMLELDGVSVTPYAVEHPCGATPYALRIEVDGKIVSYSADTKWTDVLIDVGTRADLFICEAYTFEGPLGSHLDLTDVVRHLSRISPQRILLTHLGPSMLRRRSQVHLEIADDGQRLSI